MKLRTAIRRLEQFAEACGAPVVRNALVAGVLGRVEERRIVLRRGLTLEQQLTTLVHELTHLLIHCNAKPCIDRTVGEYEAEAVERWVGESLRSGAPTNNFDGSAFTEDLLACSVVRVRRAAHIMLTVARGGLTTVATQSLQAQPAVQIDAAAGEEIAFNDELHGVRNFIRLAESP
jgi:hypothetical protein